MARGRDDASQAPESFYVAHQKIYAREVTGRFARLRNIAVVVLLGIYYLVPWIQWEGRQAMLFDLPARKFYIFGITFWPQDFFYMAWLLIIAAISLFFFTAIAGRLWCGYACPQTVWTEAFMWMERLTEGNHTRRRKLDQAPWSTEKVLRKGSKQTLWIAFALWTGITFVGYFSPIRELFGKIATFSLGPWEAFWCLFYGLATYGNAGFLREQVCKYMCPYARFQSAMFDGDTLVISYDEARGEPRGGRKRTLDHKAAGLGDCIDCNMCVQVCPTGIDIRDGLQIECIACAACIDVCDSVMDRMEYPRGLIRYTSDKALKEKRQLRILRPRVMIYGGLLLALFIGFVVSLGIRTPVRLDAIRDRNTLYREVAGGEIENVFSLKLLNLDTRSHRYEISVDGPEGLRLALDSEDLELESGEVRRIPARVMMPRDRLPSAGVEIVFRAQAEDSPGLEAEAESRFLGPAPR
ncbi:MAG: cytochrome c oxidase accessory protein CcoG [Gammaproteobacteria bacterium]|jgi:cytochrome c oxidase accessory protein FixG